MMEPTLAEGAVEKARTQEMVVEISIQLDSNLLGQAERVTQFAKVQVKIVGKAR